MSKEKNPTSLLIMDRENRDSPELFVADGLTFVFIQWVRYSKQKERG